jgi:hypothetical protein
LPQRRAARRVSRRYELFGHAGDDFLHGQQETDAGDGGLNDTLLPGDICRSIENESNCES